MASSLDEIVSAFRKRRLRSQHDEPSTGAERVGYGGLVVIDFAPNDGFSVWIENGWPPAGSAKRHRDDFEGASRLADKMARANGGLQIDDRTIEV